jgi:hypothetical protein
MTVLEFSGTDPEMLGELLYDSYLSAQLALSPRLRESTPRLSWETLEPAAQELWRAFGKRLIALYGTQS